MRLSLSMARPCSLVAFCTIFLRSIIIYLLNESAPLFKVSWNSRFNCSEICTFDSSIISSISGIKIGFSIRSKLCARRNQILLTFASFQLEHFLLQLFQ